MAKIVFNRFDVELPRLKLGYVDFTRKIEPESSY